MKKWQIPLMIIAIVCAAYLLHSSLGIFENGEYLHKTGKKTEGSSALVIALGFVAVGVYTFIFVIRRFNKWLKQSSKKDNQM